MLEQSLPIKTFRGTLTEVLSHQDEIPPDSIVEFRIYASTGDAEELFLADSLAELLEEARNIEKAEPIRRTNPRKQAVGEAIRRKLQRQGFGNYISRS